MKQTFDYAFVKTATGTVDVDDIGNCTLKCTTVLNDVYYMTIYTILGVTRIFEYGPYVDGGFPVNLTEKIQQFDYNEKRISKCIRFFLQREDIDTVEVIDKIDRELKRPLEYLSF